MKKQSQKKTTVSAEIPSIKKRRNWSAIFSKENLLIILVVLLSYGASLMNEYALDDFIVFVKNRFVQHGISGIGNIIGNDTFAGLGEQNIMVLTGGRYRPLSLVTFAIEHQIFGNTPFISHLINLLIYACCGIALLNVLKKCVRLDAILSFAITVIYIVLPVHGEAVINVKGRDDLMCLLFFLLSLGCLFDYLDKKKNGLLICSSLFYFLSLLSKESAVTFCILFPLCIFFFRSYQLKKIFTYTSPFFICVLLFLLIRFLATKNNLPVVTDRDLFNHPFANTTPDQRLATVFYTWLLYFKLIFYPVDLSYDYSFNQIPATNFEDRRVWFSIFFHLALLMIAFINLPRKSVYSFVILFYFITFSVFSNLFIDIGTPLAERFMLIPSLAICIAVIKLIFDVIKKISGSFQVVKIIRYTIVILITAPCIIRNYARCSDWKDNHSLFIADVNSVPESAKANLNAGLVYLEEGGKQKGSEKEKSLNHAKYYLQKGIAIYPSFADGYFNMGVIYNWTGNYDSAEVWWNKAQIVNPNSSRVAEYNKVLAQHFFQSGIHKGVEKNYNGSINYLLKALRYDSLNDEINYNLAGVYFTINDFGKAKYFFEKTLALNPADDKARAGLNAASQRLNAVSNFK